MNHRIAKNIVTEAQRTGRGIALEDLTGNRNIASRGVTGWAAVSLPHTA